MTRLKTTLFGLSLMLGTATLPAWASSTAASSVSDSIAASVGSISDSVKRSSDSSSKATGVAAGDYQVMEIAAIDERPGMLRMKLQAVAGRGGEGEFYLYLPQQAYTQSGLATGQVVTARQRPYGLEFANTQTQQAFFLAMDDAWHRELQSHMVTL